MLAKLVLECMCFSYLRCYSIAWSGPRYLCLSL